MTSRPAHGTGGAEQRLVADDRERFLTAEPVPTGGVRDPILASWRRCRDLKVAADRIHQPYTRDVDSDSPLVRSAEPVLRGLREQLADQPMSIILTDPTGLVLTRDTVDGELARYLDRVMLAPGFRYSEDVVGTNGIGTALEVGGPAHVFGHEHYAENLEKLACVGVPIRHPLSGRTVGAVDLTCWERDAGPLLLTLARTTAEQIRQALLADAGGRQLELLQEYVRTCRRLPGVVFAVSGDTVIVNEHARSMLDPGDQASLLAQAADCPLDQHRRSLLVQMPSGLQARVYGRRVGSGASAAGAVYHAKVLRTADQRPTSSETPVRMPLPGLVGSAPVWLRAGEEVEQASRTGEWVAVAGERGTGKLSLLRAAQLRRQPVRRLLVLDAADAGADWSVVVRAALAERDSSLVVQHVDVLTGPRLRDLASALTAARTAERAQPLWVAVTLARTGTGTTPELERLLRMFPRTVDVPPLRLHLEDLPALVTFFLGRLGQSDNLACSPETLKVLQRGSWPGNVEQLLDVLREIVRHRRTGTIEVADLPPGVRSTSRRRLSMLESLERDAVVQSLVDAAGDKTRAAASLGMSRATIYRKIHDYGIVVPAR